MELILIPMLSYNTGNAIGAKPVAGAARCASASRRPFRLWLTRDVFIKVWLISQHRCFPAPVKLNIIKKKQKQHSNCFYWFIYWYQFVFFSSHWVHFDLLWVVGYLLPSGGFCLTPCCLLNDPLHLQRLLLLPSTKCLLERWRIKAARSCVSGSDLSFPSRWESLSAILSTLSSWTLAEICWRTEKVETEAFTNQRSTIP